MVHLEQAMIVKTQLLAYTAVQEKQRAGTAYFSSEQLMMFVFEFLPAVISWLWVFYLSSHGVEKFGSQFTCMQSNRSQTRYPGLKHYILGQYDL